MAELSGQGPIIHTGATTVVDSTQAQKLGMRAYDVAGNEYVYVDFQEACIAGEWVVFNHLYAASQLTSTAAGFVGIVAGTVSASDRFGWVMVRGIHTGAWVTSGTSVGPLVAIVTTDMGHISNAAAGTGGIAVWGVALLSQPDTCATTGVAGTSLAGPATVILSYPVINGGAVAATS